MLRNASFLTVTRLAGDGLGFLFFILLSRRLGPEGIGQYAFGLAAALLVYSWMIFGLDDLSIRESARMAPQGRKQFLGQMLGVQMCLMAIVLVTFGGFFLLDWKARPMILVSLILSGYYIALGVAQVLFTPAFSQQQVLFQSLAEVLSRAGVMTVAIALLALGNVSLPLALLPFPLGGIVLVVCGLWSARHYNGGLSLSLSWKEIRGAVELAWPFGVAAILFTLQVRVSYLVLGTIGGSTATGIYASGIKFVETGVIPLNYLAMAAFPILSRAHAGRSDQFNMVVNRLFRVSLAGGALLSWFLVFVLPELIVPVFGPRFSSTRLMLPLVGVLGVILALDIPLNRVLIASGLQKLNVVFMLLGVLANTAVALLLVPIAGVFGAVAGTICGQTLVTALSFRAIVAKGIKVFTWRFVATYLMSLVAGVAIGKVAHDILRNSWAGPVASLLIIVPFLIITNLGLFTFGAGTCDDDAMSLISRTRRVRF
jgi:O-antigen/teichoic acid export membrane protein